MAVLHLIQPAPKQHGQYGRRGAMRRLLKWWRHEQEPYKWAALAQYNTEKGRGIVHEEGWKKIMASQQEQFNREQVEKWEERGYTVINNAE